MKKPLVLDIETCGLPPWEGKLLCVGLNGRAYNTFYGHPEGPGLQELRAILADPEQDLITHTKYDTWYLRMQGWEVNGDTIDTQVMAWRLNENTPLDLEWLAKRYCNIEMDKRIKSIAKVPHFTDDVGRQWNMQDFANWPGPVQKQMADYNVRDLDATEALYEELLARIQRSGWETHWRTQDIPFTQTLLKMEGYGLPLDIEANAKLHEELVADATEREARLRETTNLPPVFNLGSADQLAEFLFKRLVLVPDSIPHGMDLRKPTLVQAIVDADAIFNRKRTKVSVTDEEVEKLKAFKADEASPPGFTITKVTPKNLVGYWTVRGMAFPSGNVPMADKKPRPKVDSKTLLVHFGANPFVANLIAWRKLTKVISTYTGAFDRRYHNGRVYGSFNQTGTVTGRLSSSRPNLQNIPAHGDLGPRVRALFRGNLVIGDYSQLEPRLMAHYSQDPVLLDTYRAGKDIYLVTAEGIFGREISKEDPERQIAKTLVLALGYGAGPKKLAEILSINGYPTDVATAKGYFRELEKLYHVLFEWKDGVIAYAKSKGYVRTIGGGVRRLKTTFEDRSWKTQGYGERQAVNAIIQGSAADIVRQAMVNLDGFMGLDLLAQVHDEMLWEYDPETVAADSLRHVQRIAETGHDYDLSVPLKFEPAFCSNWSEKGGFVPIMEADEEESDED